MPKKKWTKNVDIPRYLWLNIGNTWWEPNEIRVHVDLTDEECPEAHIKFGNGEAFCFIVGEPNDLINLMDYLKIALEGSPIE